MTDEQVEQLEELLESNGVNLDELQQKAEKICEELDGNYPEDAEIQIHDAHRILTTNSLDEVDTGVTSLAYCLGKLASSGISDAVEIFKLLKLDEDYTDSVEWFEEYIGYDIADTLRLYIVTTEQID